MKKAISILLAIMMVLSVAPMAGITAFAATSGDFEYKVLSEEDKTCEITDYTGTATELTIPSKIDGYSVTVIGDWAFEDCVFLLSVTIPNGVTKIGNSVFQTCTSLTKIEIPNSVIGIGAAAFAYCSSLTNIEIPDSVISIGDSAFAYCSSLTNVSISDSITSIEKFLFSCCRSLTNVNIPNGVTEIGRQSFYECNSLEKIEIPKSIMKIGQDAFYNTAYYNNPNNWDSDKVLYIDNCLIEMDSNYSLSTYAVKNGTRLIADWAFFYCTFEKIVIPDSVEAIGLNAFLGCSSLTDISIGSGVKQIGETPLGTGGMMYPHVPYYADLDNWENGVLYIGDYLISANYVICSGNNGEVKDISKVPENYTVKDGTKVIADNAFAIDYEFENEQNLIKSITIPKSVEHIGKYALGYYVSGDCTWETTYAEKYDGLVIKGYANTDAERYAKENGFEFIALDEPETKIGDVNGDNEIKIVDAKWILQSVANVKTLNAAQKTAADLNKDGKVTIVDAKWVLQIVAGLRDEVTLKSK